MPFVTFPHPTAWNVDMISGVLSVILGQKDNNHTLGIVEQRAKRKSCASY